MTASRAALAAAGVVIIAAGPAGAQVALPTPKLCSADNAYRNCVTTIEVHLQDCEMCVITAVANAPGPQDSDSAEQWTSLPVRNGRTSISVDARRTRGMIFVVSRPSHDDISAGDSAPVVALGYRDIAPGTVVDAAHSVRERSASPCWAGAARSLRQVTVRFSHRTYRPTAGAAHVDVFWASPTLPAVPGSWTSTTDGGLATQDPNGCAAPPVTRKP